MVVIRGISNKETSALNNVSENIEKPFKTPAKGRPEESIKMLT